MILENDLNIHVFLAAVESVLEAAVASAVVLQYKDPALFVYLNINIKKMQVGSIVAKKVSLIFGVIRFIFVKWVKR